MRILSLMTNHCLSVIASYSAMANRHAPILRGNEEEVKQ